jgi:hypothetical protein
MAWSKEPIPDEDFLFCFIHRANIDYKRGEIPRAAAFQNTPKERDNLSSDWSKYSSPEETKQRIGQQFKFESTEFKNANDYGILRFDVSKLRDDELKQVVNHDPIFNEPEIIGVPNNRAHAVIIGEKDEEVRLKMRDCSVWLLKPT